MCVFIPLHPLLRFAGIKFSLDEQVFIEHLLCVGAVNVGHTVLNKT